MASIVATYMLEACTVVKELCQIIEILLAYTFWQGDTVTAYLASESVYKAEGGSSNFNSLLGSFSNKQFRMERESKERKQRNYNTFLTAFVAVTFTVALLEGVGLAVSYAHFKNENLDLETRIAAIEMRVLSVRRHVRTLKVPSSDGETSINYKC